MLPSLTKSAANIGESFEIMIGLVAVYRTASGRTKRAPDRAGVLRTSCNFQGILLTPPCGPCVGTARQHTTSVLSCGT